MAPLGRWFRDRIPGRRASSPGANASAHVDDVELKERLQKYQQADIIPVESLPIRNESGADVPMATPLGAAVVSQTCDVVLVDRPNVQACPVISVEDPSTLRQAQHGLMPNLVPLPAAGDNLFADLSVVGTLDKRCMIAHEPQLGVRVIDDVRKFGQRVGRRYSRFAFPDEVIPWLRPLQEVVGARYSNENSPYFWLIKQIASFRLECTGEWASDPYELTLVLVMEPDVLPVFPKNYEPQEPAEIVQFLRKRRNASDIATRLRDGKDTPDGRHYLWSRLADELAALCVPKPQDETPAVLGAVEGSTFFSDIVASTEYSFERYRHSDEIDLDHLSAPLPM